jgi:hypothetical protein
MVVDFMILPAKGKTIKARANSLTAAAKRNDEVAEGTRPKHTKHLDFQPHNPLKFKLEGSRVKLGWLTKIHYFAL